MVTWGQLLSLGFTAAAIKHRIAKGRLHRIYRGVYAVGRRDLGRYGHWMAAVLACGDGAVLSHVAAGLLWEMLPERRFGTHPVHISVHAAVHRVPPTVRVHRRSNLNPADVTTQHEIPVTNAVCTLVDLATILSRDELEAAISEADKRELTNPEALRAALETLLRRPGLAILRRTLDRHTFRLTDSQLERCFLPIVRRAGLPVPLTRQRVNGFRVDFLWPGLGLVVETDGLRYHRTPAQQGRDRRRDQVHIAAGLTPLRFTHQQIRYEPATVERTLAAVARRLD